MIRSIKSRLFILLIILLLLTVFCISTYALDGGRNSLDTTSVENIGVDNESVKNEVETVDIYSTNTDETKDISLNLKNARQNIIRNWDNACEMNKDEINDYLFDSHVFGNFKYKNSIEMLILNELDDYFPNLQNEGWNIKEEYDAYIADFYGNSQGSYDKSTYTGQFILQPNFTIDVIEDTIELHPENGFCTYATGEIYAYKGCYIEECFGSYYDSENNNYLEVFFPIYYTTDNEWRNFNTNIWTGLENWFTNVVKDEQNVTVNMDYEIKTCDNGLFSVFFQGQFEIDSKRKKDIAMALTISVTDEKLLPQSMYVKGSAGDAYYDYYVEDSILYFISNEDDKWKITEGDQIEMIYYRIDKIERHIYNSNGCWLGNCYYEVPVISTSLEEEKRIAQDIRADLGNFINEIAVIFEENVSSFAADIEYASEQDYATQMGGPGGYNCYLETEITYNNDGILEITYYYNILQTLGEAVVVYDFDEGVVMDHQDWQSNMMEQMKKAFQNYEN